MLDLKLVRDDPEGSRPPWPSATPAPPSRSTGCWRPTSPAAGWSARSTPCGPSRSAGREVARAAPGEREQVLAGLEELSGHPGRGEEDSVELRRVGTPPQFDFPVRDHLELGELLAQGLAEQREQESSPPARPAVGR